MKAVLCESCVRSENFCSKCLEKIEKKEVSDFDIKVIHLLYKYSEKYFLKDIEFVKSFDFSNFAVIMIKGNVGSLIGKSGRVVHLLSSELGKTVRVIEKTDDFKKMVQDISGRAKIVSVNALPDTDKEIVEIVVPELDKRNLFAETGLLEQVIEEISGKEVKFVFV